MSYEFNDLQKVLGNSQPICPVCKWQNSTTYLLVQVCVWDRCRNSIECWNLKTEEFRAAQETDFFLFFFLFWPRGLFLQSLAFPRSADIYFIALYSSAQFFPGLRMELLTLLALYSENHCQVWIKCFIWRVQLLLIHHKGSFYRIIVIGTNAMLFTIDTLIAPNSLLPVIYISMSPITPPSRFRAVYELR